MSRANEYACVSTQTFIRCECLTFMELRITKDDVSSTRDASRVSKLNLRFWNFYAPVFVHDVLVVVQNR